MINDGFYNENHWTLVDGEYVYTGPALTADDGGRETAQDRATAYDLR